ncbi:hypothetical protein R3I93_018150 [Phoxinus phoxinus]|uniref:Uncharacterized protein n=1 Tax=Phoxinus phoxinus TaxID=58324 RepID=A0AAN9GWL6_9TELE
MTNEPARLPPITSVGEGDNSLQGLEDRMPRARLLLQAHIITSLFFTTAGAPRDINKSIKSLNKGEREPSHEGL